MILASELLLLREIAIIKRTHLAKASEIIKIAGKNNIGITMNYL
jgi:hypothetical protein